jgi:uncharacterized membrane protein SpoIIM required for sporulation
METAGNTAALRGTRSKRREEQLLRLEALVARVEGKAGGSGRGIAALSPDEVGELSRLYRAATTQLAQAKTFGASTRRLDRLNGAVARAHAVVYGRSARRGGLRMLLAALLSFPLVVRRTLAFHATAAGLLVAGGLFGYFGSVADPEWALNFVSAEESRHPFAGRKELLDTLLAGRAGHGEMGTGVKATFASFLWAHNTRVALLCFFAGILLGVPTLLLVLYNGVLLGVYTATFHRAGLAYEWWAWILPHGVTELLAVVLAAGGGLLIGHTLTAPGSVSRLQALRRIRPQVLSMILAAFPMLLAAAAIESFLRQSNLGDPARYAFAVASAVAWAAYLLHGRPPAALAAGAEKCQTIAEARVPLPEQEELLGLRARAAD